MQDFYLLNVGDWKNYHILELSRWEFLKKLDKYWNSFGKFYFGTKYETDHSTNEDNLREN